MARLVPLHRETHPDLNVDGCFGCKAASIRFDVAGLKREREERDVSGGRGTREYVRDMFEQRRRAGLPDPVPENRKAAQFAPRRGLRYGGYV